MPDSATYTIRVYYTYVNWGGQILNVKDLREVQATESLSHKTLEYSTYKDIKVIDEANFETFRNVNYEPRLQDSTHPHDPVDHGPADIDTGISQALAEDIVGPNGVIIKAGEPVYAGIQLPLEILDDNGNGTGQFGKLYYIHAGNYHVGYVTTIPLSDNTVFKVEEPDYTITFGEAPSYAELNHAPEPTTPPEPTHTATTFRANQIYLGNFPAFDTIESNGNVEDNDNEQTQVAGWQTGTTFTKSNLQILQVRQNDFADHPALVDTIKFLDNDDYENYSTKSVSDNFVYSSPQNGAQTISKIDTSFNWSTEITLADGTVETKEITYIQLQNGDVFTNESADLSNKAIVSLKLVAPHEHNQIAALGEQTLHNVSIVDAPEPVVTEPEPRVFNATQIYFGKFSAFDTIESNGNVRDNDNEFTEVTGWKSGTVFTKDNLQLLTVKQNNYTDHPDYGKAYADRNLLDDDDSENSSTYSRGDDFTYISPSTGQEVTSKIDTSFTWATKVTLANGNVETHDIGYIQLQNGEIFTEASTELSNKSIVSLELVSAGGHNNIAVFGDRTLTNVTFADPAPEPEPEPVPPNETIGAKQIYFGRFADLDTNESNKENELSEVTGHYYQNGAFTTTQDAWKPGVVFNAKKLHLIDIVQHNNETSPLDDRADQIGADDQGSKPDLIDFKLPGTDQTITSGVDSILIWQVTVTVLEADGTTKELPRTIELFQTQTGDIISNVDTSLDGLDIVSIRLDQENPNPYYGVVPTRSIENTQVVCFTSGTMIRTQDGERTIDDLAPGDMVLTVDNGPQPIRWIGNRKLSALDLIRFPNLRPIRIRAWALGDGYPAQDLMVSPQHRILVRGKIPQRMFGKNEILVAAKHLLELDGIEIAEDVIEVQYFHILFDRHQVIWANGAAAESLYTGPEALKSLPAEQVEEIFQIFPQLRDRDPENIPADDQFAPARQFINGRQGRKMAERLARNAHQAYLEVSE